MTMLHLDLTDPDNTPTGFQRRLASVEMLDHRHAIDGNSAVPSRRAPRPRAAVHVRAGFAAAITLSDEG